MMQCEGCGEEIHRFNEPYLRLQSGIHTKHFHREDCLKRYLLRKEIVMEKKPE